MARRAIPMKAIIGMARRDGPMIAFHVYNIIYISMFVSHVFQA